MDKLAVDMESVRAYFKDVSDRVSAMRTDIVGLIDDQRVRLDEGRKEYLRILHRQKDVLDSMSKDLDTAIKELEKETRKPEDTVAKEPLPPTLINTPSEPQTGAAPPTP
jgi:predicted transcriptional regulator